MASGVGNGNNIETKIKTPKMMKSNGISIFARKVPVWRRIDETELISRNDPTTKLNLVMPFPAKTRMPATASPPVQSQSTPEITLRVFSSQAVPNAITSTATMIIRLFALILFFLVTYLGH